MRVSEACRQAHRRYARLARKLTTEQVREIYRRRAAGEKQSVIAAAFGVSTATVSHIVTGQMYADATAGLTPLPRQQRWDRRLTAEQVRAIRAAIENGAEKAKLAREFGVSQGAIRKIEIRETYKEVE